MQQLLCAMALGLAGLGVAGCATYTRVPLDPHRELAALRDRSLDGFAVEHAVPGQEGGAGQVEFKPSDGLNEAEVVASAVPGLSSAAGSCVATKTACGQESGQPLASRDLPPG
jgi:hypothetical protein